MKFADEFRDPAQARAQLARIARLADAIGATRARPVTIMEICGGHTHTIFRHGLDRLVHDGIEFVHGPGCPVCVLPQARVDECIEIARRPGVVLTTFGDAVRVPGTQGSLLAAKAQGADVRIVYSPLDALALARRMPDREVVFFALGFETTMPATAATVLQAAREDIGNFSLFCNHITVPPPLRALLEDPQMRIDGFIGPGHVSMVIGLQPYQFIAEEFRRPVVVSGFEPVDLLQSVAMVLEQLAQGRAEVENQYARVVRADGNPRALAAIDAVFEPRESFEWRGLGEIDRSGMRMRERWAGFDAERKFGIGYGGTRARPATELAGCRCGDVVKGAMKPPACPLFGTACRPETPVGALMVSSEGSCAAYWQYAGRRGAAAEVTA
ncbi:Fe-(CN)2CO cofactor assembly scaffold protein HypD (plasmid) [Rhodovastum atsumiense]|uniref:hydrogenase formation protein HypD n=1 Tax=Rhodovastum atsumiense TaxID=504468 RepID=UPI002024F36C|nr:hydrogenase formation protein HypD [Rhodovastum atsumiense]CAH2605579.1 Fe-(CN)2CO cofactor assembly scaffold protein HypD [Rhodovastum atsumiense]